MQADGINTAIIELTSLYDEINKCWQNDNCNVSIFQVFKQEEYRNAYEKLKDINLENIILEIITNSLNEKILTRLRALINTNILIYKIREKVFTNIDFQQIYALHEEHLFDGKFELIARDRKDIQEFPYPSEQERQTLLKENQIEKNELENERWEYIRNNTWILNNYYSLIYKVSKSFLAIIESYFPVKKEKLSSEETIIPKPHIYFNMSLVSKIHKICNNIQFEQITELDFYYILNNQPSNAKLIIKDKETIRVCYLIHKLYDYIKSDEKTNWRDYILKLLNIKESTYLKKYKEPISEFQSQKNKEFVEKIDPIFS